MYLSCLLVDARSAIRKSLPRLSLQLTKRVASKPEWPLLGIAHLAQLPRVLWKLHNLGQLEQKNLQKFAEQADALACRLG